MGENKNTALYSTHNSGKNVPCEIASSHARKIRDFLLFFSLSPLPLEVPLSSSLRQRLKNGRGGGGGGGKKEPCAAKNRLSLFSGEEFSREGGKERKILGGGSAYRCMDGLRGGGGIFFAPSCPNGRHLRRECHLSFHASIERFF